MNGLLAPCPRCSSRHNLVAPSWHYAHRTSVKRKVRCLIWSGCEHAQKFRGLEIANRWTCSDPTDDPVEVERVEKAWEEEVGKLFRELTAKWTGAQRALHARTLGIELPPEPPAQQQPPKTEIK